MRAHLSRHLLVRRHLPPPLVLSGHAASQGAWTCVAGETLAFTLVSYDSSGNRKARGGERVTFGDAQVDDRGDGSYEIKYLPKRAGVHKVPPQRRPPRVAPRPFAGPKAGSRLALSRSL